MSKTKTRVSAAVTLLVPIIFVLVGWSGIGYFSLKTIEAMKCVEGKGVVINSYVVTSHSSHKGRQRVSYSPGISYKFNVNGNECYGNEYALDHWSSGKYSEQKAIVDKFPAGREVPVWYNPQNPKTAYLVRPQWSSAWFFFLFFGVFALIGTVASVTVLRERKKSASGFESDPYADNEDVRYGKPEGTDSSMMWESTPPRGVLIDRSYETQELSITYRPRNWVVMLVGLVVSGFFLFGGASALLVMYQRVEKIGFGMELVFMVFFVSLFCVFVPLLLVYQAFGRQTLTMSREGGRFFVGVGNLGWTRRMPLDYRTKVDVSLSYTGKTRTPVYSVMLDNGANGTAKVFWVVRNEELANGFRDFIRRELERM